MEELSVASLVKLVSFLSWSALYLYSAASWPAKSAEWSSRLVTLLHGGAATALGLVQCGIMNLTPWRFNCSHYALMVFSWGYFAFDLLWCAVHAEPWLILCHHASALVGITVYMHKDYTGCTFACNLAMMEVTNPLLQTRWFLRYEGYEKTTLFHIVEVTYLVMFLAVRGVLGSYLIYKIINSQMFDLDEKIISLVLYFVSIGLIYEVVGFVCHKYKTKIEVFLDDMGIILNGP